MKVAARQRFRWIAADQRVVRYSVRFDLQRRRRMTQDIQRGTHHLRLAAQAIGILHAIIAGQVRRTDCASGNQCAQGASHVDLSAMAAQRVDARMNGASIRARHRWRAPRDQTGLQQRFRLEQSSQRVGSGELGAVQQRQASLGPSTIGCMPACASATAAGRRWPPWMISPAPIIAAAMCASGARSPDAPTEPCVGTTGNSPRDNIAARNCTVSIVPLRLLARDWQALTSS